MILSIKGHDLFSNQEVSLRSRRAHINPECRFKLVSRASDRPRSQLPAGDDGLLSCQLVRQDLGRNQLVYMGRDDTQSWLIADGLKTDIKRVLSGYLVLYEVKLKQISATDCMTVGNPDCSAVMKPHLCCLIPLFKSLEKQQPTGDRVVQQKCRFHWPVKLQQLYQRQSIKTKHTSSSNTAMGNIIISQSTATITFLSHEFVIE